MTVSPPSTIISGQSHSGQTINLSGESNYILFLVAEQASLTINEPSMDHKSTINRPLMSINHCYQIYVPSITNRQSSVSVIIRCYHPSCCLFTTTAIEHHESLSSSTLVLAHYIPLSAISRHHDQTTTYRQLTIIFSQS